MSFRLFKKVQMPGARRAMSGSVLMYVDAKSIKRNEADEPFSTLKSLQAPYIIGTVKR